MTQFMKNDVWLRYRSVARPDPLWIEQALYGGYTHIELVEGTWISRIHEVYAQCLVEEIPMELKQIAIKKLSDTDIHFHPGTCQQNNAVKLRILLNKQPYFAIQGYSKAAENFLSVIPYKKIYTDADYDLKNCQKVSTNQICALSSHMITLISCSSTNLKSEICNWGNVIVYDAETFASIQCLLQGG